MGVASVPLLLSDCQFHSNNKRVQYRYQTEGFTLYVVRG